MARHRSWLALVAAIAAAAGLGFACGSTTRSAPPVAVGPDTADGVLARSARDPSILFGYGGVAYAAEDGDDDDDDGGDDDDDGVDLATYGGTGGTRYGNYRIDVDAFDVRPWAPQPAPYDGYLPATGLPGGTIEGTVTWPRPPAVAATLAVAGGRCGGKLANRSVRTGRGGRVEGAVVFLEDIRTGRPWLRGESGYGASNRLDVGGTVIARGCELWPHVQLAAPIGVSVQLSRRGDDIRTVTVVPRAAEATPIAVELPAGGAPAHAHLHRAGEYEIVPGDGVPARAWIVVPRHPYYVVTDAQGRFLLGDVPPGTYRLTAWHPPVVTGLDRHGNPVVTAPFTATRTVRVTDRRTISATLRLGR